MNVFDNTLAFASDYSTGLTKRELFAAMAMQGLLSNPEVHKAGGYTRADLAAESVMQADALIEALNEAKEKP